MTPAAELACPRCQHPESAAANFCSRCGGALRGPPCPACDAPSEAGDRFCTQCGAAVRAERAPFSASSNRVAVAAGVLVTLLLVVVIVVRTAGGGGASAPGGQGSPSAPAGGAPGSPTPLGPTSAVDLGSMTAREAATLLFNRVMSNVEAGNVAEAAQFLPMAIAAYDLIPALSLDDRFHLSLLHAQAGDGTSALAVAEAGLAVRPTHLLCLAVAAEAAILLGDEAKARAHYQTLVDVYEEESRAGLVEYGTGEGGHANLLPVLRGEAAEYLASGRP